MKFDMYALQELHNAHGNQDFVKVICYNKYGQKGLVRARIKAIYPDSIMLDFNTTFESAHKCCEEIYAIFNTNLVKKTRGLFAEKTLRPGFLIEEIISDARNVIFHNDPKTLKTASKVFEHNCAVDNRLETDIANDPRYSLYNQFIGDRIIVEKKYQDGSKHSFSGVLESAGRYNKEKINVSMIVGDLSYDCSVDPKVDNFFVRHANGETAQIFALPVEEDLTPSQREIYRKMKVLIQENEDADQPGK